MSSPIDYPKGRSASTAVAASGPYSYIGGMGKIRSAWEIALEKTADIQLDKEKYQHDADITKIRRIAGSYLGDDGKDLEETKKELSAFPEKDLKEALALTIVQSLSLPQEEVLDDRFERITELASIASGGSGEVMDLMSQLASFLKQYPLHRKDLVEKMKEQYRPMLEEKEARMSEQYGQPVKLKIENDKDFIELASKNLERLQDQYTKTLDNAKEQLKALLR